MKSRKPLQTYDEPQYPDLESHRLDRREFLRSLGVGAIALACGAMVPSFAFAGDPGEPEMRLAGAPMAPDFFTVEMPTTGSAPAYLQSDEYLTFRIRFMVVLSKARSSM